MIKKLIMIALVGKTNAGKSTLINSLVGEEISIINKKINTTQEEILGVKNIENTQIIFSDTPGTNFLKTSILSQKKLKTNLWNAIDQVNAIIYLIDVSRYNFKEVENDIIKISEVKKPIYIVFNKIDLIQNNLILKYIDELKNFKIIQDFFLISAKYSKGLNDLLKKLSNIAIINNWIYENNEITNKNDIFISNECTRNSILKYLHKEIPYNVVIKNDLFKYLKNGDLKIKQTIVLNNIRYKPIILGKKGANIKRIREQSQIDIKKILYCKTHLYLQILVQNEK